jgi:hypothetical protein
MIYSSRLASLTLPSKGRSLKGLEINHSKFVKLDLTDGKTLHAKLVVCSFLILIFCNHMQSAFFYYLLQGCIVDICFECTSDQA